MDRECGNCKFFDPGITNKSEGYCKRRAPQAAPHVHSMILKLLADLHFKSFDNKDTSLSEGMEFDGLMPAWVDWPWVQDMDWCGEFEERVPARKSFLDSSLDNSIGLDAKGPLC